MKIEKINDHQIRCTLSKEDLEDRQIKLSELAYGSDKAKRLFRDMMEQAANDFGFEADDIPLMIEAVPLSPDSIVLIISKVDSPDELDTRFSNFTNELTPENTGEESSDPSNLSELIDHLRRARDNSQNADTEEADETSSSDISDSPEKVSAFSFRDLDSAIELAHLLDGVYHGPNSLYKDFSSERFFLIIHQGEHTHSEINRINNMISEYLQPEKYSRSSEAYYKEHLHTVFADCALQSLSRI